MDIKIYIAERFINENSQLMYLDQDSRPEEYTTLKKLYAQGWHLHSLSPVVEEDPFRTYVVLERES